MNDPAIAGIGLTRRFGHIRALRGVDIRIERGERFALFGSNGAGKTTLLRIFGLGLSPDTGSLTIDGLDPRKDAARVRGRIGWLAHNSLLYDDLTVKQNLDFWGALYGVDDVEGRSAQLMSELQLESYTDEPAGILSRGLKQRLSLARAMVHDPALLLLDEPFTGLDPPSVEALKNRLRETGSETTSTILATHRIADGLSLTDRWVVLTRGRIVAEGRSSETDVETVLRAYRPAKATA